MGYGQAAVLFLLLYYTDADVQIIAPSTYAATLGTDALIPCTFTPNQQLKDSKHFAVIWYYKKKTILETGDTQRCNTSKYCMDKDQALNGIANMTIFNISVEDGGIYQCSVSSDQFQKDKEITVTIQAVPKITVVNDVVMIHKKSFLCCEISEFYPVDINITWLRDGEPLDNVLEGKLRNNPDGSYSINSSIILRLTEEDRERNFSCRVQHVSLPTPRNEVLQLIYGDTALTMTGPSTYTATLGSEAHIPCTFEAHQRLKDSEQLTVLWYYDQNTILSSDNTLEYNKSSKYSLDQALNGTANLMIFNTSTTDNGSYTCSVRYGAFQEKKTISVTIHDEKVFNGYKAEIVLGCLFGVSVLIIIIICLWWKHNRNMLKKQIQDANIPMNPVQGNDEENVNAEQGNDEENVNAEVANDEENVNAEQGNDEENVNAEVENDPEPEQSTAEERKVLNQEKASSPRRRAPRQQDTAL